MSPTEAPPQLPAMKPHPEQAEIQRALANWFGPIDPATKVVIGTFDEPHLADRFAYHRPPPGDEAAAGIRAYRNRNLDGSQRAIEGCFGPDPKIVWLSPKNDRGPGSIRVDLSLLRPGDLRRTGQAEGYLWHRGDIPAVACSDATGK